MNGTDFYTLRLDMNLTQADVSKLLGVSGPRTVRKWESGERKVPRSAEIFLLCLSQIMTNKKLKDYVFRLAGI